MKPYTVSIDIGLSRQRVIKLFDNTDNMFCWQTGLQSFEHLSGEPGQVGARSKMIYVSDGNRIELYETITKRNLPEEFHGEYEWDGGKNTLENFFIDLAPDRTRWESRCAYEFKTLMMKAMGFFFSGSFKKQNQLFLDNFKAFCETGADVRKMKSES